MRGRTISGWQMVTADLALILFIIAASAVRSDDVLPAIADSAPEAQPPALSPALPPVLPPVQQPALGNPVAIHTGQSDVPLMDWLDDQAIDTSQTITVWVQFAPDDSAAQLARSAAMLADIQATGREARILATPAAISSLSVTIAHDASPRSGM